MRWNHIWLSNTILDNSYLLSKVQILLTSKHIITHVHVCNGSGEDPNAAHICRHTVGNDFYLTRYLWTVPHEFTPQWGKLTSWVDTECPLGGHAMGAGRWQYNRADGRQAGPRQNPLSGAEGRGDHRDRDRARQVGDTLCPGWSVIRQQTNQTFSTVKQLLLGWSPHCHPRYRV